MNGEGGATKLKTRSAQRTGYGGGQLISDGSGEKALGRLKILGYEYTIERREDVHSLDAFGKMNAKAQSIPIANDLAPEQQQSTLLHEIIEALSYHLDLKLKHSTIMSLESGLYQVLVDNGIDLSKLGE